MPHPSHNSNPYYEIEDLIGNPPGWLLHSGITILVIIFTAILLLAGWIKYPDKVIAQGVLTSDNPPIEHVNKVEGILENFNVKDGLQVKKGQTIATIRTTLNKRHLAKLERFIYRYEKITDPSIYFSLYFPKDLKLGNLSPDYSRLQLLYSELLLTLKRKTVDKQIAALNSQIEKTSELETIYQEEKQITEKEVQLVQKNYKRQQKLNSNKLISDIELEKTEAGLLQSQKQLSNLNKNSIENRDRKEGLLLEIERLNLDRENTINQKRFDILEVINKIKQQRIQFSEDYEIKALIDGTVHLNSEIKNEMYLKPNTWLISIIPNQKEQVKYARVLVSESNFSKIEVGQKAMIKLNNYPYKEHGVIDGQLGSIALLPSASEEGLQTYALKIPTSDTLETSFGNRIPFKLNSGLKVEVITEDRSILSRIFSQFIRLIQ